MGWVKRAGGVGVCGRGQGQDGISGTSSTSILTPFLAPILCCRSMQKCASCLAVAGPNRPTCTVEGTPWAPLLEGELRDCPPPQDAASTSLVPLHQWGSER